MKHSSLTALLLVVALTTGGLVQAEPFLPGTGKEVPNTNDDFEDPKWEYILNHPKASGEEDHTDRAPMGRSRNGRVFEHTKRGHPDSMIRIPTPAGGLAGSTGSLLIQTRDTGVPGRPSGKFLQDDLHMVGASIAVSRHPSIVVRVFVPPFAELEKGLQVFGIRAAVNAPPGRGQTMHENDPNIYPGFFIQYFPAQKVAAFRVRASGAGDFDGPVIRENGWYSVGMSFSADHFVHYYVRKGVGAFEEKDRIGSYIPYGRRGVSVSQIFFNLSKNDDAKTWSAQWIIDDPKLYYAR